MALFTQFILAARIFLAKKNPSSFSLFREQSFAATHSSNVKFLKRAKKQGYHNIHIHLYLIPFLKDTRLKINPLRLRVDFKVT